LNYGGFAKDCRLGHCERMVTNLGREVSHGHVDRTRCIRLGICVCLAPNAGLEKRATEAGKAAGASW